MPFIIQSSDAVLEPPDSNIAVVLWLRQNRLLKI